jgi:hypothetical protein
MPYVVVWTADIDQADENSPAIRVNSRRCGIWLEQVAYAEERAITSGEVYVFATMTNDTTLYIFEQTLDSLRELSKGT